MLLENDTTMKGVLRFAREFEKRMGRGSMVFALRWFVFDAVDFRPHSNKIQTNKFRMLGLVS